MQTACQPGTTIDLILSKKQQKQQIGPPKGRLIVEDGQGHRIALENNRKSGAFGVTRTR